MVHFPVISSVLSAEHLADFLRQKYAPTQVVCCSIIKTWVNDTYLVTAGIEKYIFRVYRLNWRTQQEIAEEIRLIRLIRDQQLPVSYPIADLAGNYIQHLSAPEGGRYGVMFSFAEGDKIHNLDEDMHFRIGAIMAQIHQVTEGVQLKRTDLTPQVLISDAVNTIGKFIAPDAEEARFLLETQTTLFDALSNADKTHIRKGAVHLDIWGDNMNISKDGKVTLFDFDFCSNGWLCCDIAFYISLLFTVEPEVSEYRNKTDAFFRGYESVTAISREEKRLLPELATAIMIYYLGVQCLIFTSVFINEVYIKRFITARIKRFLEFSRDQ